MTDAPGGPPVTTTWVTWFEDLRITDRASVGGKCASLGELLSAGIPVPGGFAVTVEAWEATTEHAGLRERIGSLTRGVDTSSSAALGAVQEQAARILGAAELAPGLERAVRQGYAELCRRAGRHDLPVAVRSSAVAEDGAANSFAGQQETYLWVVGADRVLAALRSCWASLFTPQAIAYREGLDEIARAESVMIAVAVQEMVDARVAGVAFTVSPTTGDRSVVAVNASWGLGEAVVSGEVTPDEYWLTKVGPRVTRSTIASKQTMCVPSLSGSGTEMVPVPDDRRDVACLSDDQVVELATLACRVEKHYGAPQDIEWALTRDVTDDAADGSGHRFVLLQSRPETVSLARQSDPPVLAASYLSVLQGLGAQVRRAQS